MEKIKDFEDLLAKSLGFASVKDLLFKVFERVQTIEEHILSMPNDAVKANLFQDLLGHWASNVPHLVKEITTELKKELDAYQIFEKHGSVLNLMMDHNNESHYDGLAMTLFEYSIREAVDCIVRGKSQGHFARKVLVPKSHPLRNKSVNEMDELFQTLVDDTKRSFDFKVTQPIEADNSLMLTGSFNYEWPLLGKKVDEQVLET